MYQLKKSISAAALRLSSFIMAVLRTAKHNINRAVTFILAVILMTGSFAGYLTPVVSAADDDHSNSSNDTSASSSFAGEPKKAKTKARKAPSGQLRSAPTEDMPLDSYITDIAAAGTTKIEDNLYQMTLEFHFEIDTACIDAVTSAGYKFVYDFPEEVIIPEELVIDGPFYAYLIDRYPELELAFTYDFVPTGGGHYRVEIVYDDVFVQDAIESGTDMINNILSCRCWIRSSGDAGQDGLNVAFTDTQTLHIPPEDINENYDITTQKTGSYTADGKLRYEVTVSSVHGTPSEIDVTDTFTYSGGGTVSPPTEISVVKHNADGTIETSSIPAQGHIDALSPIMYEISLNLPQLHDNEYYTLVYEYGVTGLPDQNAAVSAYNTLEATSTDNNETTSDHADYFIYNKQPQKVGKDGIPFGEYIQWYISVNDRGGDIAGKVIYDNGFADAQNETILGTKGIFVQRGWADATPGVDYEFVYNNDNEIIGVHFLPEDGSTPNNNTYHITYYTLPDVAYGETAIVHNDAEFDGDTVSYDVVVTGGDIDKTADGEQSLGNDLHGMNWTINVQIPVGGIQSGTSFSDTLSPDGHYMTQSQYNALVSALQTAWGTNVSVTPVYTGGNITGYTFTVGTAGSGYLFDDDDGTVEDITWQYQTTGDMSGKVSESFVNTFSDGQKTLPVINNISPNVKKLNVQKISDWQTIFSEEPNSLSFDYEDEDKSFVWIAQVTPTPGLQQYRVTDTLPEGVELIGVKVIPTPLTAYNYGMNDYPYNLLTIDANGQISGEIGNLWNSKTLASGQLSTSAEGRQVVDITLTANSQSSDLFSNTFYVIYYCQLAEDMWPQNGTVHLELNNTVSVETIGGDYGEADNQINIDATKKEKIVDKTGSWNKNLHMINYTVDINPSAENLLTGVGGTDDPEWLSLTDVLTYTARQGTGTGEAILSLSSVQLEKEENGVWSVLNNIQWTAHTKTDPVDPNVKQAFIEMEVPDSTHLRLTYSYQVNSSMSGGITLTNSAMLEGHGDESGDDNTHIEADDFETFGESTFEEFWLIKTDQEDGRPLSNAVFTVYTWDAVNEEWYPTTKTYTTDPDGKITIKVNDTYDDDTRVYLMDTAYCIMETTAPPGYVLPENPPPFYFWFSKYASAPHNAPSDFMQSAADISTSSYRIEAENLRDYDAIPAELTITKTVTGSLGDKTKEFVFTLTVEDAEISDEYSWTVNGVEQALPLHNHSTFTLKHGDVVKIMLPVKKDITIRENNLDYSVSIKLNDDAATAGNTKTFRIYEDSTLAVTNDRNTVVPTGIFNIANIIANVIVAVICLIAFLFIFIRRIHNKGPTV
ncbi:MAG: SpaA isopeptide-forming pilin-related protein [Eubacteriales bacterium]|nr:SpaA isopeptide-forming pilin-related protein [Eubacteriales bacterium]